MERQNGGRVSVSVFPTFQGDVEIAKVENGQQPIMHHPPPQLAGGDAVGGGGGIARNTLNTLEALKEVDNGMTDLRMVMKHHNGNYEGAPPSHPHHPSYIKQQPEMGHMDRPSFQRMLITFCSEFVGTYILLFLGCMGCVFGLSGGSIPHQQISFVFGFAVLIAVQCVGHVSGGHINPMVTVASVVLGNTPIPMAPVYMLGQFVGAIAGYGSVMLVTPSQHLRVGASGVCSPALNPELSPVQGLAVEFIASSMLVLVCCAVWDRKNTDKHDSLSIRFGLTIAVLAMAAGPYSGANMNPARSFAPALLNGDWSNHWIYWVGPLLAGAVTTSVYKVLFNTPPPEEKLPESIPLN